MSLNEYLYIDDRRLNMYFEQISGPITYDKVPVWKAAFGLTGPKAEGSQARYARSYTDHEKISALTKYLEKMKLVDKFRPEEEERRASGKVFRTEICNATRIYIPPKPDSSPNFKGLSLWISPYPQANTQTASNAYPAGALYLIEDFPRDDEDRAQTISGYSTLLMMMSDVGNELLETILDTKILAEGSKILAEGRSYIGLKPLVAENFATAPFDMLASLGAHVGADRTIQTLYRVRATLNDEDADPIFSVTTIGYPIFIVEVYK